MYVVHLITQTLAQWAPMQKYLVEELTQQHVQAPHVLAQLSLRVSCSVENI